MARIVDAFPYVFPYLVGAISVWASPNQQRLGDRWANTVVVTKESIALPSGGVREPGRGRRLATRARPASGGRLLERRERPSAPASSADAPGDDDLGRGNAGYHWVWSAPSASVPVQSPSATRYSVSCPATCFT